MPASQADRFRAERLRHLHLVEIPRLRLLGCALLAMAVLGHNLLVFGRPGAWLTFATALMAYALAAGLLLQVLHGRLTRFDPAVIFLSTDLAFWAWAIYVTGADHSLMFFIVLIRVADQTITRFARALVFAHLAPLAYVSVVVYVARYEHHPVDWSIEFAKILILYAASVYVSLVARTGDRRRQKRAEAQKLAEELSETAMRQQLLLTRIFNATSDGLVFIGGDGYIESANSRAGELLGVDPSEVAGIEAADLLGRDLFVLHDGSPFGAVIRSLVANPVEQQGLVRQPASGRVFNWTSRPTRDPKGLFIGLTITLQDVTRPHQLIGELEANARLLEEARRRAEEASRARSEFLANITHELRTPLSAIIGLSQLALESGGSDLQVHLRRMKISAESLLAAINDILDYSKMQAGRFEIERVPFAVRAVVDEALDTMGAAADEKGLDLTRHVDDAVPDAYLGDPVRLRQILLNLVSNGIKFTEHGGVNVVVRLASLTDTEAALHFEVSDTGIGIPRDKQELVFEAFAQADSSTTRRYGGSGLGLSIASRLASLMGGNLWLESEPGQGSRFHFTVQLELQPAARPRPVAVAIEGASKPEGRGALAAPSGRRVLMADDSPLHRELLAHLLRSRGYDVVAARNGREAVELFETSGDFRAVLLDWQMPEMDGLQTAQAIRRAEAGSRRRVLLIGVTAGVSSGERTRGLAAGADYFLSKPIATAALLGMLESGIERGEVNPTRLEARRAELLDRLGDKDLATRMIELFLVEGPRLMGDLRAALDRRDAAAVRKTAHALHGAVANFPLGTAPAIAAEMERFALAGDLDGAERLFSSLQDAVRELSLDLPALL